MQLSEFQSRLKSLLVAWGGLHARDDFEFLSTHDCGHFTIRIEQPLTMSPITDADRASWRFNENFHRHHYHRGEITEATDPVTWEVVFPVTWEVVFRKASQPRLYPNQRDVSGTGTSLEEALQGVYDKLRQEFQQACDKELERLASQGSTIVAIKTQLELLDSLQTGKACSKSE